MVTSCRHQESCLYGGDRALSAVTAGSPASVHGPRGAGWLPACTCHTREVPLRTALGHSVLARGRGRPTLGQRTIATAGSGPHTCTAHCSHRNSAEMLTTSPVVWTAVHERARRASCRAGISRCLARLSAGRVRGLDGVFWSRLHLPYCCRVRGEKEPACQ